MLNIKNNNEEYSEIFKALGNPIRLAIVKGLMQKESCNVNTMVLHLGVSQPTVSQHLNILKNAKIISSNRKGTEICYKLTNENVKKIVNLLDKED